MKNLFFFICLFLLNSCSSSLYKFGEKRYFNQRVIRHFYSDFYTKSSTYYFSIRDDGETCFKDNPKNKETITVDSKYIEFALDHFYKRVAKVNVVVTRVDSQVVETTVTTTENVNFDLEMAYCYVDIPVNFPWYASEIKYVSFRLAD